MNDVQLSPYTRSDHAWLVAQHQKLYQQSDGFDDSFGPLVDQILTDFESNADPSSEAGWIARQDSQRLGSIFCVRTDEETAKLRLFLTVSEARGRGLGRFLLNHCMSFAKQAGYKKMTLWTHESHLAACALYVATGWSCASSKPVLSFGVPLIEQQWEITL